MYRPVSCECRYKMLGRDEGAACKRPDNTPLAAAKPFINSRRELASVSSGICLHSMIGPPLSQNASEDFEKVGLVLKLQVDFQPSQVQRCNGFFQMVRAINPI